MHSHITEKHHALGSFQPTVILHGGAGAISRASLSPELWARYEASLWRYLTDARKLLDSGASALDAACAAATWFEDDPLFNCGRGSVFTEQGTVEMEASAMVCSLDPSGPPAGQIKRGAAVSLVRNTRHPILLAREVLMAADGDGGMGGTSTMHCHLSGRDVEEWGWEERGLEKKPDRWFWTKRRWEEHRRGLQKQNTGYTYDDLLASVDRFAATEEEGDGDDGVDEYPSQGTVGAVCLDSWGNLAVATSTGGLTNKKVGRIGDTPTIGSGFWAETWEEEVPEKTSAMVQARREQNLESETSQILPPIAGILGSCLTLFQAHQEYQPVINPPTYSPVTPHHSPPILDPRRSTLRKRRRAVAMSGTGNGDSFLRTNATRTAASMCRFSSRTSLARAVSAVAGPGGELQQSAGDRWGHSGEGQGGIIGIEIDDGPVSKEFLVEQDYPTIKSSSACSSTKKRGRSVFDFNCGGLFRAYYELDEKTSRETPKVMVFKEEY
ncbi:uncharacterized protein PV06_03504 [Exophiala oligosperma]|uniref:Asparaginase n=1 Tax=Exophiala oligosperma TaxID=215243 RepID=A0A0D2DQF1_9EURO|nr:uncharacterized protein PV06_03504 [Exophiala oligosperma]KIW45088.1 hypothetical protein PV06_03504 [Exophiala oligosperma]